MKLSHSKLNTILKCPATYYLNYKVGIKLKYKKPALSIGEAVHWGLEHSVSDLTEYYLKDNTLSKINKPLEEAMISGYLYHKEEIFKDLLRDYNGDELELIEELHELELTAPLRSYRNSEEPHEFLGIIDLMLVTNKGLIIVDYKTSSVKPDFNQYLDQIYRYIFLTKANLDLPILKIAIINIQKSKLKKLRTESEDNYKCRLEKEYILNDNDLINWFIYDENKLDNKLIDNYINNLSRMADIAQLIDENKEYYINFNAINDYGGNDYKEIFLDAPSSFALYTIKDTIYDKECDILNYRRDCCELDIEKLKGKKVINNYDDFQNKIIEFIDKYNIDIYKDNFKQKLLNYILKDYDIDKSLYNYYLDTFYYYLKNA